MAKTAKDKTEKTNAMRMLDQAGISYGFYEYEYDESDLSGNHAAAYLGIDEDQMFKTLVARGEDKQLAVFVIPVSGNLDLKKAASASHHKKVEMIHVKELVGLTGYMRGGCSPIGMKKAYPTYIDETCILFDEIYVSAGRRGEMLSISPEVLLEFVGAETADIVK